MGSVIVAAATPWGRSALSVVRLSGQDLDTVLKTFVRPHRGWPVPANRMVRVDVLDEEGVFDDGLMWVAAGSRSFTGEPTAEISLHGNPRIVERVLDAAIRGGAHLARPGEFSRRAVLSGKLDLIQAEAVLQVAAASTDRGLAVARAGLDGRLSAVVADLRAALLSIASSLEAMVDHPEADLEVDGQPSLLADLAAVEDRAVALAGDERRGRAWVHGVRVALVGAVNAGKSSLFNAILGERRALVHDQPGTTRDVVEGRAMFDGLAVTLLDTAGERPTADAVELAGQALAREQIGSVDAVLIVWRARPEGPSSVELELLERLAHVPHLIVYNGVDCAGAALGPAGSLPTVALTGQGVAAIAPALKRILALEETMEAAPMLASARQRDRLLSVARLIGEARSALPEAGPAVGVELVIEAIEEVDSLRGTTAREEVLDALFSRFCIGK
jgi:tRNA modification GTPase